MYSKIFVFLILICSTTFAQPPIPPKNSVCWKISGNNLKQDSYLYGTIHLIDKKDFFVSENATVAFKSCNTLALEIDLNMSKEVKQEVAKSAILPNGKTLEDYTTPQDYAIINSFMKDSLGLSKLKTMLYGRLKPIYLQSLLIKEQIKKSKSYEETFIKMAKKNKMTYVGLEDVMLQVKILDTIPITKQMEDLVTTIKEGKANLNEFNKLIAVYKKQDIELLWRLTVAEDTDIENFEEIFITNRNNSWIPVIENLISKNATFIAVGAAHLGSGNGIINLLQMKGYTVEPIF